MTSKPAPPPHATHPSALATVPIEAWRDDGLIQRPDEVIAEAPLLIRLGYTKASELIWHDLVVTMRTPGDDARLALGYLIAEGIIEHRSQVAAISESVYEPEDVEGQAQREEASDWPQGAEPKVVAVRLEPSCQISPSCLNRRLLASSSCGICGKTALGDLLKRTPFPQKELPAAPSAELLARIDGQTRRHQPLFKRCGAVHSSGLFTAAGEFIAMFEDVGRHNAFDKLVGFLAETERLPASELIVWLSGRVSFELCQKAIMAGVGTLVAVGAPSQLAVHMAKSARIRLLGFADGRRFNMY